MKQEKILITGAFGQLGTELIEALNKAYHHSQVILSDIRDLHPQFDNIFEPLDVCDTKRFAEIIDKHQVTQVYHLAAILSAKAEQNPRLGWEVNFNATLNVLEVAREKGLKKIYFPSSIAVFGNNTPRHNTPQYCNTDPNTIYGIAKLSSERWCEYYFQKYKLDVRSLRYPGIISYKTLPGGGTTDYAVDIYHKAIAQETYECFLSEHTYLPMMYINDAIRATLELMEAPAEQIKVRSSYNLAAMSFSPQEVAQSIQTYYPEFQVNYKPDFRQAIADSWPSSIDDSAARQDWHWEHHYDLPKMTQEMLENLAKLKNQSLSLAKDI